MKNKSDEDCRETKDILINGYIFTLVKGRIDQSGKIDTPRFMGCPNWALKSIIKMKRNNKPKTLKRNK